MEKTTHIAIVPSPLFSLIVSSLEFSSRLLHLHPNFHITCIIPVLESSPIPLTPFLQTLPPRIDAIFLPPIPKQDLPKDAKHAVQLQLTITKSLPHLRHVLNSLNSKSPLSALLSDSFSFEVLQFAKELNVLSFVSFPSSAMVLSLLFHMPKLDQMISGEFPELPEAIRIPGCVPLRGSDVPEPIQRRSNLSYKHFVQRGKSFHCVDGVLLNSFLELEENTARELTKEGCDNPPVYLVGPVTQKRSFSDSDECLRWLENQPPKSVLYICFGSGGTLSQSQTNELAFGLEESGKRFLWVLRVPSDSANVACNVPTNEDPLGFLPKGFLERTKERGLVVPSWAPQIRILRHSSIGGFLNNCGWNSIIESVQQGVPLIALPLFAEQRTNAVLVSDGLKVALRPKVNENGVVDREEVGNVIKSLMEGEEGKEISKRMKGLKDKAANAVKDDGSSTQSLRDLAFRIKTFTCDAKF
ncbi:hydroquinone glucosyltransferase-like [Senna tora]|uniref:Hydroquinone glucosyltransferase-like n=1 Tax=Senna tora TaxID=362788 RepID=A0A834TFA3_9FABA|nr:hydroquinone glucosyltransferase-like [Senna tora]